MTGDPRRATPGGEGDNWESLAQDLFGIEFTDVPSGEDLPLPDEPPVSAAKSAPSADAEVDDETPVGGGLPDAPDEVAAESGEDFSGAIEADEPDDELEIVDDVELELTVEEEFVEEDVVAEASEARPDDTYWDALNDWQWDEPRERPHDKSKPQGSRRPSDRPSSREPASPPKPSPPVYRTTDDFPDTSELRDEYVEDDAFGAGLWESSSSPKPADEPRAAESREMSEEPAGEREPHRRRRRRRRRRGPDEARTSEAAEPIFEDEDEDDMEAAETSIEEESREADTDEPKDRQRRRRRRRRRRDEAGPASAGEKADVEAPSEEDFESLDDNLESDDEDSQWDASSEAIYRRIPTWEEAISYLLHPSRVESAPRDGSTATAEKSGGERPAEGRGSRHKSGSRSSGRRRRRR